MGARPLIGRCARNTGADLGPPERGRFYSVRTPFEVTVGKEYPVLGLGLFETILIALVCDDTGLPNWLPVGLFDFDSQELPEGWWFALLDGEAASGGDALNRWAAKWGYEELVRDPAHGDGLIERDREALDVFFRKLRGR